MEFSNSPLVCYTQISPNRNSPRNHKIDTITIHSLQGNATTVKDIGEQFAKPERQASCNYGIAYDGKIALICPESDRSWCSSSRSNDHRAITIEVSTLAKQDKPRYKVYPAAYAALIELLVDICRRNGIPKLLFKNDKSLIGQPGKQNMTLHRWFYDTDCPGQDLYNLMPEISEKVNARLSLKGDVNGDGKVDIADVTAELNILSGKAPATSAADVNGDGKTDIRDVTAILDIAAGKETVYRVQVAACTDRANAIKAKQRIPGAYIEYVDGYYKVFAGAYKIRANAEKKKASLLASGVDAIIVTV